VRGGVSVTIVEKTEYPFRQDIELTVNPARPAVFPLELRIPAWAAQASIRVNGKAVAGVKAGMFLKLERKWKQGDKVEIVFPMQPRLSRWYHNSVAVERGPLVYSLKIGEDWKKVKDRQAGVRLGRRAYHAVELRPGLRRGRAWRSRSRWKSGPIGEYPFSPEGAPQSSKQKASASPIGRIVAGPDENDSAGTAAAESRAQSAWPEESIVLIPYGAAKLRITAFPEVK
jgi:hypothetical protein